MPHLLSSIHFGPQAAVLCDSTSIPKELNRYQDSLSSSSSWVTSSPAQSSPWLMRLSHSTTEALCSGPVCVPLNLSSCRMSSGEHRSLPPTHNTCTSASYTFPLSAPVCSLAHNGDVLSNAESPHSILHHYMKQQTPRIRESSSKSSSYRLHLALATQGMSLKQPGETLLMFPLET